MEIETPTETQTATEAKPSVREQMLQTVEEEQKAQDDENSEETDEKEEKEPESKESDDDSESDKDEEEDEDKEEDKPSKKLNRYQRIKAKLHAQEKASEKFSSERDEAVKFANIYRQRLLALEQRFNGLKKAAEGNGLQLNPLDEENFKLKLSQRERELSDEIDKSFQSEKVKEQLLISQQEQTYNFANEALTLASKYTKDKAELRPLAQKILKSHAVALRNDPDTTLAETAKLVMALSNRKNPEAEQQRVNSSAPKPMVKKALGTRPTFEDTKKEALAFLDAELKGE